MVRRTSSLDTLIREALAEEDAEALEGFEDQSVYELLAEVFRGRNRLFAALGMVFTLIFFVIGVGAAVSSANAEEVRPMMLYAGTSALSFGVVLAIKVWYWVEMARLALTRELKRVELQIVGLTQRIRDLETR